MNGDMNNVFKETALEVNDPDPLICLQNAITEIPEHIASVPAKVMICIKIKHTTVNHEELDVWVSTKLKLVITFSDLNREWAEDMRNEFLFASEEAKLKDPAGPKVKYLKSNRNRVSTILL